MWTLLQTKEFKEWYLNLDNAKTVVITKKILVIEKIGNLATLTSSPP